jgi:peroxiredoxin family protein
MENKKNFKQIGIIIRDDRYDKILTPLVMAMGMAEKGVQVNLLFVNWAVRAITSDGVKSLKIDGRHASEEAWLKERIAKQNFPVEIHDYFKLLKATGKVTLNGCYISANAFDVSKEDLVAEADALVDTVSFMERMINESDHCQYF